MPSLVDILKKRIGVPEGKSKTLVANMLGVSEKTIENYINGKRRPNTDSLIRLSEILNFDLSELSERNVPHETPSEHPTKETYLEKRRKQKNRFEPFMVPLVPVKAQAGYSKAYNDTDFINTLETFPILPGIDPRGTTWRYFEVEGDSMLDTLEPRNMLLANFIPNFDWKDLKDNYVYVIVTTEDVLIKRVKKKSDEEWTLRSDNKQYKDKAIKIQDVLEVWKARRTIGGDLGPVKKTKHYDLE